MKTILISLMSLAVVVSCSKVEKMEDKTSSMERTTKTMSQTTDKMETTTSTMFQQIRSKEAEATRASKIEELLNPKSLMGTKLAAACIFYKSFEYQLWDPEMKFDTLSMRELLMKDAVDEFTQRVLDIYNQINTRKMDPSKSVKSNNHEMAFYALGVGLHMNHSFQEGLLKNNKDVKVISFLTMIQNALIKDSQNLHLTEYEGVLVTGQNKEIMIELLKARVDMISAIALNNLTDLRKMNVSQLLSAGAFLVSNGSVGQIEIPETLSGSNASTQEAVKQLLTFALDAKRTLKKIGVDKSVHKTIRSGLKNIDMGQEDLNLKARGLKSEIKVLLTNLLN